MSMLYPVHTVKKYLIGIAICTFDFSTNMEGSFVVILLFYVKEQPNLPCNCIVYPITNLDNDYLRGLAYIYIIIVHRKGEFWVPGRKSNIGQNKYQNQEEPHIPSYFFNPLVKSSQIFILIQSPS